MNVITTPAPKTAPARVLCAICTHTVDAEVVLHRRGSYSRPGQRCPRCASSLDAAVVLHVPRAA